jgi:hypothetical protein
MPTETIHSNQSTGAQVHYTASEKPDKPKVETEQQPATPEPQPTPVVDDLDANVNDILSGLGYPKPKSTKESPKPEAAPEPKETAKAPTDDAAKKADEEPPKPDAGSAKVPDKRPAKASKKSEQLDAATVQALARDAANQVFNESKAPVPATPPTATPTPDLDDKERRNLEILRRLEQEQPQKYRGLADKTLKGTLDFKEYRRKWEMDNPDDEFDPESEEHQKVASKLLPDYDQDDFEDARITIKAEQIVNSKEREKQKQEAQSQVKTRLNDVLADAESSFIKGADEELHGIYTQPDGVKKMMETDKLATRAIAEVRKKLVAGVTELEKLMDPQMEYSAIPGNPVHEELAEFAIQTERTIKRLPLENQIDADGRRFVSQEEFHAMNPSQRGNVWTLTKDHLRSIYTQRCAEEAKALISDLREGALTYAKAKGYGEQPSASNPAQNEPAKTPTLANTGSSKPNPPNTASSSDSIKTSDQKLNTAPDLVGVIMKELF